MGSNGCSNADVLAGMAAVLVVEELVTRGLTVTVLEAVAGDVLPTAEMGAELVLGSMVLSSVVPAGLIPGLVSDLAAVDPTVCPSEGPS